MPILRSPEIRVFFKSSLHQQRNGCPSDTSVNLINTWGSTHSNGRLCLYLTFTASPEIHKPKRTHLPQTSPTFLSIKPQLATLYSSPLPAFLPNELPILVNSASKLSPWIFPASFDLMNCSPPGSSVHGIAISFSRGSSWPRDQTQVSSIGSSLINAF